MATSSLYSPLDASRQQIRLLRFTSQARDATISGSLQLVDLAAKPEYVALSYAWGSEEDLQSIQIDGHALQIRRNLFDFLEMFIATPECDQFLIWIDQISIDQSSVTERNHQVSIMGAIYREAQETWSWLGRDPHEGLAFRAIRRLLKEGYRNGVMHSEGLAKAEEEACQVLLSSLYFSRHWIAQEIILARRCLLRYGTDALPWENFSNLIDRGRLLGFEPEWSEESPVVTLSWLYAALMQDKGIYTRWDNAMQYASLSICQDPRDKIFGIQSLFPIDRRVDVDYTKDTRTIYLDAIKSWFETDLLDEELFLESCINLAIGMGLTWADNSEVADWLLPKFRVDAELGEDDEEDNLTWPQFHAGLEKWVLHKAGGDVAEVQLAISKYRKATRAPTR